MPAADGATEATLVDLLTIAVDAFIRDGGGTYDELQAVIDQVVERFFRYGVEGEAH